MWELTARGHAFGASVGACAGSRLCRACSAEEGGASPPRRRTWARLARRTAWQAQCVCAELGHSHGARNRFAWQMLWRPGRCAQFAGTCGKPEAQPLRTRVVELYPPLAPSRGYGDAAPPGGGAAPRPRGGALALLGLPHAPSAIYGPLFDPHSASSPRRRPGRASSLIFCTPAGARQPRRGKHPPINRGPRVAVEMNAALAGDAPRSTEHRHGYEAARSLRPEPATTRCCRRKARAGLDGEYTHARIPRPPRPRPRPASWRPAPSRAPSAPSVRVAPPMRKRPPP